MAHKPSTPQKKLYRVCINWYGEQTKVYRHAYSPEHAWRLARRVLSMRLGVDESAIEHHIQHGDKRSIKEEVSKSA